MLEIPRAILLPPPNSTAQRASVRGGHALDQDLPAERGAKPAAGNAGAFLTLIETRREDTIELKGKQFRFRPYGNRGDAERAEDSRAIERPAAEEAGESGQAADEVLTGFAAGDGSRNSAAFLASFIAQEQLAEGLHNPPHAAASDAYRRAGGSPAMVEDRPRVVRFAA
jgi:hypothetical protein